MKIEPILPTVKLRRPRRNATPEEISKYARERLIQERMRIFGLSRKEAEKV